MFFRAVLETGRWTFIVRAGGGILPEGGCVEGGTARLVAVNVLLSLEDPGEKALSAPWMVVAMKLVAGVAVFSGMYPSGRAVCSFLAGLEIGRCTCSARPSPVREGGFVEDDPARALVAVKVFALADPGEEALSSPLRHAT